MSYVLKNNIFRQIERIEYKWMIHELSSFNMNVDDYLESPEVYGKDNNYKCCLQIYPNADKEFLSTYVKIVPLKTSYLKASFSVSILDKDENKIIVIYTTQFYNFYQDLIWGFDDFMPRSELLNYLDNDMLTLLFEINILHPSFTARNVKYIENSMKVIASEISQRKADILVSVEGMLFYTHKDILTLNSGYFKTVIRKLKKQDIFPIFHLSDIDCNLFAILIQYMYTGKFDDVEKNVKKILKSADKYEIVELKKYCEDTLIKTMNVDNIVELLSMAEQYRANKLRNHALQFIIYRAKEIIKSQAWNYFVNRPNLASLIHGEVMSGNKN